MLRKLQFSRTKKISAISFVFAFLLLLFSTKTASAQVVINEFVPNGSPEWVEFHNASGSADYLKDYWIDDDTDFDSDTSSSTKKHLTSLNTDNVEYPYIELSSMLNNSGDHVVLFDGAGKIIDQYQYTSDPGSGISIGRSPDITGDFFMLVSATKAGPNSSPPTPSPTPVPTQTPSPTQTSTPAPTATPTPIPTRTSTPKPAVRPTAKPIPSPSGSPLVLAEATGSASVSPSPRETATVDGKNRVPMIAFVLIGLGALSLGGACYPFLKEKIKGYNEGHAQIS